MERAFVFAGGKLIIVKGRFNKILINFYQQVTLIKPYSQIEWLIQNIRNLHILQYVLLWWQRDHP